MGPAELFLNTNYHVIYHEMIIRKDVIVTLKASPLNSRGFFASEAPQGASAQNLRIGRKGKRETTRRMGRLRPSRSHSNYLYRRIGSAFDLKPTTNREPSSSLALDLWSLATKGTQELLRRR